MEVIEHGIFYRDSFVFYCTNCHCRFKAEGEECDSIVIDRKNRVGEVVCYCPECGEATKIFPFHDAFVY